MTSEERDWLDDVVEDLRSDIAALKHENYLLSKKLNEVTIEMAKLSRGTHTKETIRERCQHTRPISGGETMPCIACGLTVGSLIES